MNVIRHDHVSPNADSKVSCSSAIFDERLVHFRLRQYARTSVSIERHKIDWRVGSLEY